MTKQTWNAQKYQTEADFVARLGNPVLELLAPQAEETILDLGCGDGELTQKIANYGGIVTAIDSSPEMIALATQRGLKAEVLAAEAISYQEEFDAVFSNAVLHWVKDINKATQNVYQALKPGGRYVGEFGGEGNIKALTTAIATAFLEHPDWGEFHSPWYFPSIGQYSQVLEEAGFRVMYMEIIPRPTPLKSGVTSWLDIFAEGITHHLDPDRKEQFRQAVASKLKPILYTDKDGWVADYVRIRFYAIKE